MRQRLLREPVSLAPACRSGTWRAPARRAACPAIRTARQAPGATCGRHDLRAPVRQFLGAIASCAWPVTAPLRATPCPPSVRHRPPATTHAGFCVAGRGLLRRDLPTRPRPHARRHGGRHVPFLIRTRLSCRPALPFLLPPFPRPPRPCSGKHGRPTWTSAANGIGWAWARRSSNGWPSMAAPSSQSWLPLHAASWTWRTSPPGPGRGA